jgi:Ca2+-binding EF-hand superfamily protein
MNTFSLQAHHLHRPSPRIHHTQNSPRPHNQQQKPNALVSGGRLVAGTSQHGGIAGAASGISWQATLATGAITRDERMGKIRHLFGALDLDNNNIVTEGEFIEAMAAENVYEKDARALFKQMDDSRTGHLTVAKFDHYVAVHTLAIVRSTFKDLDTKHDRQIKKNEFAMYFMGNGLSRVQVGRLWNDIDKNRNGKINFVEYRDWALERLETTSLDQVAMSLGMSSGG